jgi:hypothetical protein
MRTAAVCAIAAALAAGCATLREVAALRRVAFALDGISDVRVAGVSLKPGLRYADLGITDTARLAGALRTRSVPIEMTLRVRADNPPDNPSAARIVSLDWKLFVEDRETLAGAVAGGDPIAPGTPAYVPIAVRYDLLAHGSRGARDLFDLAIGIAGLGGTPRDVRIELRPVVDTPLGPIAYPQPVVIRKHSGA